MKIAAKRIVGLVVLLAGVLGAADARAQENVDPPAELELPDAAATEGSAAEGSATGPESEPEPESIAPWTGTYAEGMAEVVRLAANEEHGVALELTERLLAPDRYARLRARLEESLGPRGASWLAPLDAPLAWVGLESLDEPSRAEVRYVRGLLCARTGAVLRADEELGLARALAGPGATRNDAVYALGTLDLLVAEELRKRIPEVSGAAPAAPGSTAPGDEDEPDPLELARAAYEEARVHLVERLRLDWRDENTRANTELVQRRLRELDEIERQREEEQEQDPQQQESQDQDSEDQESEDQESEDQDSEDQDSEGQESEDQESEDQDSEQQEESEDEESQESEDAEPEEESEDAEQESEAEPEERILTQEEMMRLLQEFQRYQEQGEELREQNRRVRREKVDKDW